MWLPCHIVSNLTSVWEKMAVGVTCPISQRCFAAVEHLFSSWLGWALVFESSVRFSFQPYLSLTKPWPVHWPFKMPKNLTKPPLTGQEWSGSGIELVLVSSGWTWSEPVLTSSDWLPDWRTIIKKRLSIYILYYMIYWFQHSDECCKPFIYLSTVCRY